MKLQGQRVFRQRAFGDTSELITSLTSRATEQAKASATQYAIDFYNENQAVILLSAVTLITWILWVSTRNTCKGDKS
jgi:hypothetical protein